MSAAHDYTDRRSRLHASEVGPRAARRDRGGPGGDPALGAVRVGCEPPTGRHASAYAAPPRCTTTNHHAKRRVHRSRAVTPFSCGFSTFFFLVTPCLRLCVHSFGGPRV